VSRVLACLAAEHNLRLVLLAALVCAATSFTSFRAYCYVAQEQGARRVGWIFLTAICTGAGIWASYFVAMLAYEPGHTTAYDPILVIASLLIAATGALVGFAISSRGSRPTAIAGGAIIGVGIGLMRFTGLGALHVPGTIAWHHDLIFVGIVMAAVFGAAALLAWHELRQSWGLWLAPALLMLAVWSLHLTGVGAIVIEADPRLAVPRASVSGSTLAISVSAIAGLVLLAFLSTILITSEGDREALVRSQELVDAAFDGVVEALDGRIVNVNTRIAILTGWTAKELQGRKVVGDLLAGDLAGPCGEALEGRLATATGPAIPVEVVRRSLGRSARANEVYTVRDLTERRRVEAELRRQNVALQQREDELGAQNRRFQATLANMPLGLCMIDPEFHIVICNQRYIDMYGLPAHLVQPGAPIAGVVEYRFDKGLHTQAELDDYRRNGFKTSLAASIKTSHLTDGRTILISLQPTGDGGWIALHEDITERHALSTRLEEQNVLLRQREQMLEARNHSLDQALAKVAEQKADLDVALASMSQGLAMFDADERLVLANDRYAEIYGLEPRHLKLGTTLRELIEYRIARGLYPGMTADDVLGNMRGRLAGGNANQLLSKPRDGRTISVSIQPRSDGGWVVTLHDLTERETLNAQLREQNALLRQREEELAAQNALFDTAIGNMSQGMCLYDSDHRIVFANARFAELYGLSPDIVRPGASIRDIIAARIANDGCRGPEADSVVRDGLAGFAQCVSELVHMSDGRYISVVRRPMPGGGMLTTHEDITERERLTAQLARQNELLVHREQELNVRNEQLDVAMNNMAQGLAMLDPEQRLIICNRRYREMYGHAAEEVRPGTSLRQILEHRFAKGVYPLSDKEAFIDGWTTSFGEVSSRIQELSDGRIISVLRRRTGDGGRVITHEDITERQQLHTRLEEQNCRLVQQEERLRTQNLQLDAALNNMLQGLALFDADLRLVLCNKRYALMYGLSPEQVLPGASLRSIIELRIAKGEFAGKSAEELIKGMLARSAGQEATHYTSQLTDGRYIAVSVQPMPDGGTVTTHHDITEQRRSEAKIAHMALHDTLTGLPNRVLLNERLDDALRRFKRGEIVATHLIDLDHFKTVNDTLGHPAGDSLLKSVADRLRSVVRETDTIARMGGDEFAIVQTGIVQPADATALAHRVIEAVGAPYVIEGHQVVIGTSIGIAVCPTDGTTHDQLIRNADLALYRAKGDGRRTYRFFEQEMDAQMQARRLVENDLREALAAGQFELHYQPYVNLERDEISGFEALVRWRHPEKGLIAPGTFVPLAEEIGLIIPLGEWAIREACAAAVQWPGDLKVAVNLSPAQFKSAGLVQVVINALATTGLPAERLELEITETTLMLDSEATLNMLYQMRALGVRIALDDFGTGYSSLSLLQSFPFDKLKIDRSFVKDIAEGVGSLNIVRAVTAMAAGLGMTTTAEGVETQQQLDTVRAEGCTEMQGFVYSKPLPAAAVGSFLSERHKPRADRLEPDEQVGGAATAAA